MALTAESITNTALDILSRYGLGDLSMRRLARELEVQPSALYWHVRDKQALFVLISQSLTAEVDTRAPVTADPLAAVLALREVLLKYRDGAEILLLGYSVDAAEATPVALARERLGRETSHAVMVQTLGAVAIAQNRALFAASAGEGESASTAATKAEAEADFASTIAFLLSRST